KYGSRRGIHPCSRRSSLHSVFRTGVSPMKGNKPGSEFSEMYFFGFLLLVVFLWRIGPKVEYLWKAHHLSILLVSLTGAVFLGTIGLIKLWNRYALRKQEESITEEDETSVFLGKSLKSGREIHLKESFRTMHALVIGTTNAGKSESVILPWAIQD